MVGCCSRRGWPLRRRPNVACRYPSAAQVALLAACHRRGIPVLAVAGAGAKADPTRVRIVDVGESVEDPLARAVRQR